MLYEFYGIECPHCQKMRKLTDKLVNEFDIEIIRKEVWHNKENMKLLKQFDNGDACGGLPFFYNNKNKTWLCGEVGYDELKTWAEVK